MASPDNVTSQQILGRIISRRPTKNVAFSLRVFLSSFSSAAYIPIDSID